MDEEAINSKDVEQLGCAAAYPHDPSARDGVEHVQTHISWVFLTAKRVYKLRKPVNLGFVDFTTRARRNADCQRELVLNRRLTNDVYLGLAPLVRDGERVTVGNLQESETRDADHFVVMRRLAPGGDALTLLEHGALTKAQLVRVASVIAQLHATQALGRPAPWSSEQWSARVAARVEDNFSVLTKARVAGIERAAIERAAEKARAFLESHRGDFERRRTDGRAVDGHGDLHLAHVWFEPGDEEPRVIDCLEFSDDLRKIDAAADVAFLAMDLRYRARAELAEYFLATYAELADDHHLYSVVDYYIAYRAGVRAKVAALAAEDERVDAAQRERAAVSARSHLELACRAFERRGTPALVLLCGIVGSGKSTAAALLADELAAVRISSDQLRRRLHRGMSEAQRYGEAARREIYHELFERARVVLGSGRTVVLDATFESRTLRAKALACASSLGLTAWLVQTTADPAVINQRLAARSARAVDASEAGPEQYQSSVERFEEPIEWPVDRLTRLATDKPNWASILADVARLVRGPG